MLPVLGKTRQHCCAPRGHKECFWRFSETFFVSATNVARVAKRVNIWKYVHISHVAATIGLFIRGKISADYTIRRLCKPRTEPFIRPQLVQKARSRLTSFLCRLYEQFAAYMSRGLCNPRLIFPRINSPNVSSFYWPLKTMPHRGETLLRNLCEEIPQCLVNLAVWTLVAVAMSCFHLHAFHYFTELQSRESFARGVAQSAIFGGCCFALHEFWHDKRERVVPCKAVEAVACRITGGLVLNPFTPNFKKYILPTC